MKDRLYPSWDWRSKRVDYSIYPDEERKNREEGFWQPPLFIHLKKKLLNELVKCQKQKSCLIRTQGDNQTHQLNKYILSDFIARDETTTPPCRDNNEIEEDRGRGREIDGGREIDRCVCST